MISKSTNVWIMVALGGNATLKHTEETTAKDQKKNVRKTSNEVN